jgi:hypothetical protein
MPPVGLTTLINQDMILDQRGKIDVKFKIQIYFEIELG